MAGAEGAPTAYSDGPGRPPTTAAARRFEGFPVTCDPCVFPITIDAVACTRIAVMLIPSYTAAWLTGEMVWTVPTLAAASVLAASLKSTEQTQRAVDDDGDGDGGGDPDGGGGGVKIAAYSAAISVMGGVDGCGLRKPRTARPRPSPRVRGFQGPSSVPPSVALLRLDGRLLDLGLAGRGGRR